MEAGRKRRWGGGCLCKDSQQACLFIVFPDPISLSLLFCGLVQVIEFCISSIRSDLWARSKLLSVCTVLTVISCTLGSGQETPGAFTVPSAPSAPQLSYAQPEAICN